MTLTYRALLGASAAMLISAAAYAAMPGIAQDDDDDDKPAVTAPFNKGPQGPAVRAPAVKAPQAAPAAPSAKAPAAVAAPAAPAATPAPVAAAPAAPATTPAGPAVTAAQATAAEAAMRNWMGGMLGPSIKLADRPITMTPAGDHFDVVIPLLHRDAATGGDITLTAVAKPIEGGKWSVNAIRYTSPIRYTVNMPVPSADGSASTVTKPVTYTATLTGQDGTMVLDPSLASPTTYTGSQTGATVHAEGGTLVQDSTFGATNSVTTIRPASPGRVDFSTEGTIQSYALKSKDGDAPPVDVAVKLVRVNMGMTGVSREKSATLTRSMTEILVAALSAPPVAGGATAPPKVAPQTIHTMLDALQDVASSFTMKESFEDIGVNVGGMAGKLGQFGIGLDAKSVDGILQAGMDLSARSLTLPELPLGGMEVLIPQNVALRPFISGIGVPELMRMAQAATDKKDPAPADIMAMFSHGGITTGLESMTVALGGATFTGQAKFVALAPDPSAITGTAQITAENFDALVQKFPSSPALAQFVPVLIFTKGIGRTVNDKLVWDIVYKDNKVLVNNVDISAMAAGAPPAAPKP